MGDFLVDFRPARERQLAQTAASLRFMEHTQAVVIDDPAFGLVITLTEAPELWAPFRSPDGTVVAVAGRVALDAEQWRAGEAVPGTGGLAGKAVYALYRDGGMKALERRSGNCALLVYDPRQQQFHLVADCAGAFPVFQVDDDDKPVFSSHPDVLAAVSGEADRRDETSMAEFILASTVTPPFTYYQRIQAMEHGTVTTVSINAGDRPSRTRRRYFDLSYRPDHGRDENDLAAELAEALRNAVRRRTLPRLGRTAVALSGGLDSRTILACMEKGDDAFAFCCFNESNRESRTAESIARAAGVRFVPLQREFDYYADNAEEGVRISGGMGTIANNHFLGMIGRLRAEGMQNLLTGCYFDYLFKGLPLNRKNHWLTGREQLAPFRHEFYFSHHLPGTTVPDGVRERWESRVPAEYQRQESPSAVFQVEARRTFPLCYEGDNQQRVVPQRATGWYLPVADRDILDLYCRIPYQYKLNRSLFLKTARILCRGALARVPDANTGARVGASPLERWLASNCRRARRKLRRARRSIATDESWPNWPYYVPRSRKLEALWQRPNPAAFDFFRKIVGPENVSEDVRFYHGDRLFLFVSLLTLKLWFDQRGS